MIKTPMRSSAHALPALLLLLACAGGQVQFFAFKWMPVKVNLTWEDGKSGVSTSHADNGLGIRERPS